jgi:hypothetical protein
MHCGTLVLRSAATRTGGIGLGAACRFHVALGASARDQRPGDGGHLCGSPQNGDHDTDLRRDLRGRPSPVCAGRHGLGLSLSHHVGRGHSKPRLTSPAHIGSPI